MNESLLADVDVESVSDDIECVEYVFMFNFFPCEMKDDIFKNIFRNSVMTPALERLKNRGCVSSWVFEDDYSEKRFEKILDIYSDSMYHTTARSHYFKTKTLSVQVAFDKNLFSDEVLGLAGATLAKSFMMGNLSEGHFRLTMKKVVDGGSPVDFRCIYYEFGYMLLYAGDEAGFNDESALALFTGGFVRCASGIGLIDAVDDNRSRYVLFKFGNKSSDNYICLFGADGNEICSYRANVRYCNYGPKFLDNGLMYVNFGNVQYNYMRMDGSLVSDRMYNNCSQTFSEGYSVVSYRQKNANKPEFYNLIDKDGNLLLDDEYVSVTNFKDGHAIVCKITDKAFYKYNVICKDGKVILDRWFDDAEASVNCRQNIIRLRIECGSGSIYNYLGIDGTLLLDKWVRGNCHPFVNGFALLNDLDRGASNYIREDGTLVSDEWFKEVCGYPEYGVFAFKKDNMWQFMDMKTMQPLFDGEKFDYVTLNEYTGENYYHVTKNEYDSTRTVYKYLFVSADGVKSSDETFEKISYVGNRCFFGQNGSSTVLMKWGGDILSDSFVYTDKRENGYVKVACHDKTTTSLDKTTDRIVYNIIGRDGSLLSKKWFNANGKVVDGFVDVRVKDLWYLLTPKGVLLFRTETNTVNRIYTVVPEKLAVVEKIENGRFMYNMFDADGKQVLEEWTSFRISPVAEGVVRIGFASFVDYSGKYISFV